MKAFVIRGSFGLQNLVEVDLPQPAPGPGEVRVDVRCASLNFRDLLMVRGLYNPRQPLPLVPVSDGVGVVGAVGPGVDAAWMGRRVVGLFAQGWSSGAPDRARARATLGGPLPGMLQESVVLPLDGVAAVPSHLSDAEASCLPCAALTAWSAVVTLGGLQAGDTVLVQGSGGVSSFALDFAVASGARVIAVTRSADKASYLEARGASHTLISRDVPRWGAAARSITDGRGVDLVVEVGGAGTLAESLSAVRMGGTVAMIGVLAGARAELDMTPVLMRQIRVQGVLVGHADGFARMCRAIDQHRLVPAIDRVFAFDDSRAAFERLASGEHRGKVCIAGAEG